jgi:hypothetical protein
MDSKDIVSPDEYLRNIFEPDLSLDDNRWRFWAIESLIFFAREYAKGAEESPDALKYDHFAMGQCLSRFVRDAYGVKRFNDRVTTELTRRGVDLSLLAFLGSEVAALGLRINSSDPRKTRIAAAFTLWMAVFRPVSVSSVPPTFKDDVLMHTFCFEFTFSLARQYLCIYGETENHLGVDEKDREVRIANVVRALECRQLDLSTLETLFSGIFRPYPD